MRFLYRPYEVDSTPGQPDVSIVYRPTIPIRISGSTGDAVLLGLLDTGADETLLPAFLIERIGVTIEPKEQAQFRGVGGEIVTVSYGMVDLEVGKGRAAKWWSAKLGFLDSHTTAILGRAGFLQYFTATFNGLRRQVTLTANDTFPPVGREKP